MTAVHRMQMLEQQAGTILHRLGYTPVIMSDLIWNSRYIPYNLTARKTMADGSVNNVMVKLKISLYPIQSLEDAALFSRDEMGRLKRFFAQAPAGMSVSRFEVWISIPSDQFQQFEIRRNKNREILAHGETTGLTGGVS